MAVDLADGTKLMELVETRLEGVTLIEEVFDAYGLYEKVAPDRWQRIDETIYSL